MQTIGPYRLLQALGTCQVGGVWSAADNHGNRVDLAILNADAARDPGWRNAFADAANRLGQTGQVPVATGDFTASTPWVATGAGDGSVVAQVFTALGQAYQPLAAAQVSEEPTMIATAAPPVNATSTGDGPPASESHQVPAGPHQAAPGPQQVSPGVYQVSPGPIPTSGADVGFGGAPAAGQTSDAGVTPALGTPAIAATTPGHPQSSPPAMPVQPMQGQVLPPMPSSAGNYPPAGYYPPASDLLPQVIAPVRPPAADPQRRRAGLLVVVLLLIVVLLGGGGAVVAFTFWSGDEEPGPSPTAEGTPPASPAAPPPIAAEPGVEPPLEGEWPSEWPEFGTDDAAAAMTLGDLDFAFHVPRGWDCTNITSTDEEVHYVCGPDGVGGQIGGDLIVRACADPCDADRRVELRRAEEAWGLQWVRDGGYRSWAESDSINETSRYGLVYVGYSRTSDEGRIDRQVVLRMTAPVDDADDIRKVANSVRAASM